MTIYIITFNNTTNVGASLQEYALYKYLCNKGHDVFIIDYLPDKLKREISFTHRFCCSLSLSNLCRALLLTPIDMIKNYKFWTFTRNIRKTPRCHSVHDIQNLTQPDLFICGSDQIWNPDIAGYDEGFFLHFLSNTKKASYSASIGKNVLNTKEKNAILKLTEYIDYISVREKEALFMLPELKAKGAIQTLDPVFLLPTKFYEEIAVKPTVKNYILVYEAEMNKLCGDIAKVIADRFSLKTVQIERINNRYRLDKVMPCVSPAEFIGLVAHADFIVTNSFHGIALSIILKKDFYYIPLAEKKDRVSNLLEIGGLQNRLVQSNNDISYDTINYQQVTAKFSNMLKQSQEYLNHITST